MRVSDAGHAEPWHQPENKEVPIMQKMSNLTSPTAP